MMTDNTLVLVARIDTLVAAAIRGDLAAIHAAVFGDLWTLQVALVRLLAETYACCMVISAWLI